MLISLQYLKTSAGMLENFKKFKNSGLVFLPFISTLPKLLRLFLDKNFYNVNSINTQFCLPRGGLRSTHLNSFSSRISQQNTHFNMQTETSKHQEGCRCKDSHP